MRDWFFFLNTIKRISLHSFNKRGLRLLQEVLVSGSLKPTVSIWKILVIGRELVSMRKGALKSEEFQMSELHIHELRAPVALLWGLPADPASVVGRMAMKNERGLDVYLHINTYVVYACVVLEMHTYTYTSFICIWKKQVEKGPTKWLQE